MSILWQSHQNIWYSKLGRLEELLKQRNNIDKMIEEERKKM
jgi:hypothetical protein